MKTRLNLHKHIIVSRPSRKASGPKLAQSHFISDLSILRAPFLTVNLTAKLAKATTDPSVSPCFDFLRRLEKFPLPPVQCSGGYLMATLARGAEQEANWKPVEQASPCWRETPGGPRCRWSGAGLSRGTGPRRIGSPSRGLHWHR